MTDTDISTLRTGYDVIKNQAEQIDRELDQHKGMVKALEGMQAALLSAASVVETRLLDEGVVLNPEPDQLEIPFEVVR